LLPAANHPVQKLSGAPDGGLLAQANGGKIGKPRDVVEVEVREEDVEPLDAIEHSVALDRL
jgi:hypothetical protein